VHEHLQIPLGRIELSKFSDNIWSAGCGDEVCTIGLYTSHYGQTKNIPVVRVGHIALMPDEPIRTRKGYVAGYLIETKSIAGLSGSPVYVNVPQVRMKDGRQEFLNGPTYIPLGILVGYHVVESKTDQILVPQYQEGNMVESGAAHGVDERNTGFAVVIPIERVIEIFEIDSLVKHLDIEADRHYKESGYVASGEPTDGS